MESRTDKFIVTLHCNSDSGKAIEQGAKGQRFWPGYPGPGE